MAWDRGQESLFGPTYISSCSSTTHWKDLFPQWTALVHLSKNKWLCICGSTTYTFPKLVYLPSCLTFHHYRYLFLWFEYLKSQISVHDITNSALFSIYIYIYIYPGVLEYFTAQIAEMPWARSPKTRLLIIPIQQTSAEGLFLAR